MTEAGATPTARAAEGFAFGTLDARALPTIELPHGKAQATFHVILARAFARDTHLVRDVALASTSEL